MWHMWLPGCDSTYRKVLAVVGGFNFKLRRCKVKISWTLWSQGWFWDFMYLLSKLLEWCKTCVFRWKWTFDFLCKFILLPRFLNCKSLFAKSTFHRSVKMPLMKLPHLENATSSKYGSTLGTKISIMFEKWVRGEAVDQNRHLMAYVYSNIYLKSIFSL